MPEQIQRRRGRIQNEIAADQFRNVTFRAQASVYNALARRAAETGKSVTDVLEALVMQHLLSAQPAPSSLTAEDVRQIVREEMVKPRGCHSHSLTIAKAGEPRTGGAHYAGFGLWLREDGSPVFPEDAHIGGSTTPSHAFDRHSVPSSPHRVCTCGPDQHGPCGLCD